MRIQIFSDLHADVMPSRPLTIAPGADLVVVAGDVCAGTENGFTRLRDIVPMPAPIVMVAGNHKAIERVRGRAHLAAEHAIGRLVIAAARCDMGVLLFWAWQPQSESPFLA